MDVDRNLIAREIFKIQVDMGFRLMDFFKKVHVWMLVIEYLGLLQIRPVNNKGYHHQQGKMNQGNIQAVHQGRGVVELVFS